MCFIYIQLCSLATTSTSQVYSNVYVQWHKLFCQKQTMHVVFTVEEQATAEEVTKIIHQFNNSCTDGHYGAYKTLLIFSTFYYQILISGWLLKLTRTLIRQDASEDLTTDKHGLSDYYNSQCTTEVTVRHFLACLVQLNHPTQHGTLITFSKPLQFKSTIYNPREIILSSPYSSTVVLTILSSPMDVIKYICSRANLKTKC